MAEGTIAHDGSPLLENVSAFRVKNNFTSIEEDDNKFEVEKNDIVLSIATNRTIIEEDEWILVMKVITCQLLLRDSTILHKRFL
jgi:predicted RNA methylase